MKVKVLLVCIVVCCSVFAEDDSLESIASTSEEQKIIELNAEQRIVTSTVNNIEPTQNKKVKMIVGGQSEDGVAKQVTVYTKQKN